MHFTKKHAIVAFIGGCVLYLLSILSWKGVHGHFAILGDKVMKDFKKPAAVADVIINNASESGVYLLKDQEKSVTALVGLNLDGPRSVATTIIGGLFIKMIAAFLAFYIISFQHKHLSNMKTELMHYFFIALFVACVSKWNFLIKGYYSFDFTLYSTIAIFLQWIFAGAAMTAARRKLKI